MKKLYLFLFLTFLYLTSSAQEPFVGTLRISGSLATVVFQTQGLGYNYNIDFGNGSTYTNVTGDISTAYTQPGIYTFTMSGDIPRMPRITFILGSGSLHTIEQWGDIEWRSMDNAFSGYELTINATDVPNLSQVTSMRSMFSNSSNFDSYIGDWDVSTVTDMSWMFSGASSFNQSLMEWDVSNVTNMEGMFRWAKSFNQSLENWDVSNVENFDSMFFAAEAFNQPLGSWNLSGSISAMFSQALSFNQPLNNWNVSQVTNMDELFNRASSFDQPLNNWDTSNVTSMVGMFQEARSFNQRLDAWNVSQVSDMSRMFKGAFQFNQPLDSWDVSQVINMEQMFESARRFNQPLGNWNISQVQNIDGMFASAVEFNQNINNWNISSITSLDDLFYNATKFNQPLNNWNVGNITSLKKLFSGAAAFNKTLNNWDVSNVTNATGMFQNSNSFNQDLSNWNFHPNLNLEAFISHSGIDISNYELLLSKLDALGYENKTLGAERAVYCDNNHRQNLINKGWIIEGDGHLYNCNESFSEGAFVTRWKVEGNLSIEIGINVLRPVPYNYSVNFGDGVIQNNITGIATHTYSQPGIYTVSITGDFPQLMMYYSTTPEKLISVEQWGNIQWHSMSSSFYNCKNMIVNATDAPDLSAVSSMESMFWGADKFNSPIDHWDVSNVTNMSWMFYKAINFDQSLENWDVSNVTAMNMMFNKAVRFNSPVAAWNVSNVTNMSSMFSDSYTFDQELNEWDVSSVTNMKEMFAGAELFNQPLDNWDVSNVTNMSYMFGRTPNTSRQCIFNQPINAWNTGSVTDMSGMFKDTVDFNQPLDDWDVSGVTTMAAMFSGSEKFNQSLNFWDVSQVENMSDMFNSAKGFNSSVATWDTSAVTNMKGMFCDALSFNQNIDSWNVANVTTMEGMFEMTVPSNISSFNQTLQSWDVSNVITMKKMFSRASKFNQPIGSWNVSNVTDLSSMFEYTEKFDQPLNDWDVSNVTLMKSVFAKAKAFNQPLDRWNVSEVTSFANMFEGNPAAPYSQSFNQPLDNWDVSNAIIGGMFYNAGNFNQDLSSWEITTSPGNFVAKSGLNVRNYDALLYKFATLGLSNISFLASNLEYCDAITRDYLINNRNWIIQGDSASEECNTILGIVRYDENLDGCDTNDSGASGFRIEINDGNHNYSTFSLNGNFTLSARNSEHVVSIVNSLDYLAVTPPSAMVSFENSNVAEVNFCVSRTTFAQDLNIVILPISDARPGFVSNYRLLIENLGTATHSEVAIQVSFDPDKMTFLNAVPAATNSSNAEVFFILENLHPFSQETIDLDFQIFEPPIVTGGDILTFTADVLPVENDITPQDNTYTYEQIVVNSFDPNDKLVLQGDEIHLNQTSNYLDYIIRFQNTGTAAAVNVRIVDTLHSKLDWSTLRMLSSSHNYHVEVAEGNKATFYFNDIYLPHEGANEPESHGFIAFRIKPKGNLQIGDAVTGDAKIFFDYNPPIVTNTVSTTIIDDVVGIPDMLREVQVVLFPNPTSRYLNISLTKGTTLEKIIVYDLHGRETLVSNEPQINTESLNDGIYILKIITDKKDFYRRFIRRN